MIFVAVGTQAPFDRLVSTIDDWAAYSGNMDVFAQIGRGARKPRNIAYREKLSPDVFRDYVRRSTLFVSHAGIGSVITALDLDKPILVMPRLAIHGEHRNDHQVDTCRQLQGSGHVSVAWNEDELLSLLSRKDELSAYGSGGSVSCDRLISFLKHEIRR